MDVSNSKTLKMDRCVEVDRLNPPRTSRIYFHLTCLRNAIELAIAEYVANSDRPIVLDYGCGDMPYRPLFEKLYAKYEGHDLLGNIRADYVLKSDGNLSADDGSTDVVLSSQVLEHVEDPGAYLRECHRVLKVDGLMLLSTHGVWQYHPDPTDYWRWTSAGLTKTIRAVGFEILRFKGIVGPAATGIQIWQDATLPRVPKLLKRPFSYILQAMMRRADAKCSDAQRDADASVFLCVARKQPLVISKVSGASKHVQ